VRIDRESLNKLIATDSKSAISLFRSMAYKYYSAMDQIREGYNHNSMWRVYNLFVLLSASFGEPWEGGWTKISRQMSQQTIGDLLGLSRNTVGIALKELMEKELILFINGYYCIRSIKR